MRGACPAAAACMPARLTGRARRDNASTHDEAAGSALTSGSGCMGICFPSEHAVLQGLADAGHPALARACMHGQLSCMRLTQPQSMRHD
jgi:hypothetical protein